MSDQKKAVSLEVWGEQAWVPEPICTMDFLSHWAGNRMGRGREMGLCHSRGLAEQAGETVGFLVFCKHR